MDLDLPGGAAAVALLLHPHPDMGGNRFNHVVDALFRGVPAAGLGAARFDFADSDLDAAAAATEAAIDQLPSDVVVALVGYSFGALVALRVARPRVAGWFLIAPPLGHAGPASTVPDDLRPKVVAAAERDQFTSPDRMAELTAAWRATTRIELHDADHFLAGATEDLVELVTAWLGTLTDGGS